MADNRKKKAIKKLPWRAACRDVMHAAAVSEAKKRSGLKKPTFLYRWEHVCAVVTVANKLAIQVGADVKVVEAAAWLHDVAKMSKDQHPIEGAKFAREFLPTTTFPVKKIEAVAVAIEQHMGLFLDKPLKNLEAQVLWDADKLTKIGLTSALHFFGGAVGGGRATSTEQYIESMRSIDWREKTVASMHTKPAKKAARKRADAVLRYLSLLEQEVLASDI